MLVAPEHGAQRGAGERPGRAAARGTAPWPRRWRASASSTRFSGSVPVLDGVDQRFERRDLRRPGVAAADQDASQPAAIAATAASRHAVAAADRLHLEIVAQDQAADSRALASAARRRSRGDSVAGRSSSSDGIRMCAVMIDATSAGDRRAERHELDGARADRADARPAAARDASRRWCRRARENACRTRRCPRACSVAMIAAPEPRDVLGALGQRAIADHRVLRDW